MSGFETIGGILNIIQIIGVISRHVHDYNSIQDVLEEADAKARRIQQNVQPLLCSENIEGLFSHFFDETVEESESIRNELYLLKEKVVNRTTARTVLTSPNTVAQLEKISRRLAHKERNIELMGMFRSFNAEHR